MESSPQPTLIVEFTGIPLPSHHPSCRCGARIVDLRGYLEHNNLRPTCTACGVELQFNVSRTALGDNRPGREARFHVSPGTRFNIFRRDKYCCVHCGRPAPRAGDAFENIRSVLADIVGSEQRLTVARDAHAATCITCGNLLPGIFQSIPFDVVTRMSAADRARLFQELDKQRLTIDHLFPESILEIDGVVRGPVESTLVTDVLLATSCMECNWGRRATLEDWTDLKPFLQRVILPNRRTRDEDLGYAHQIYFRVQLELLKQKRTG